MNTLPWLVVHGPIVWQIGLALSGIGALAAAYARPRLTARRAAEAARARLGPSEAALVKPSDGMRVTLTGVLAVDEGSCARFEDGSEAAAASAAYAPQGPRGAWITGLNARAPGLSLLVGGAKIALEGPVEVIAGSREVRRGLPLSDLPAAVQDRVAAGFQVGAPHFRDYVTVLRSLGAGDRVRVTGVLRREALGGEAAGYRAAGERWALVPEGDAARAAAGAASPAGLCAAFEGAPRIEGPGIGWSAKHLLGGAIVFALVFGIGGAIAVSSAQSTYLMLANRTAGVADGFAATGAAAALSPFGRAQVVEMFADVLDLRHDEDAAIIEQRVALHRLHGGCEAAADALARHGSLERAADEAAACGAPALEAKFSYAYGNFGRASDAVDRLQVRSAPAPLASPDDAELRFAVRVHLLAGRADRAATAARRFADALTTRLASGKTSDDDVSRASIARCLADAIAARAGVAEARARLLGERGRSLYPACAALLADVLEGKERVQLIHDLPGFQASAREVPMRWLDLLEQEADPSAAPSRRAPEALRRPSLVAINPARAIQDLLPAVERSIAAAGRDPRAAAAAAVFAAAAGDVEAARRFAAGAAAEVDLADGEYDRDHWDAAHARALRASVELSAGDAARAEDALGARRSPYLDPTEREARALVRYRGERSPADLVLFLEAWSVRDEGVDHALESAARGDGAALAAFLRRPSTDPGGYLSLAAPLVLNAKHEVISWIRLGYRMPGWFRSAGDQLAYWTTLASAARALGDGALAADLDRRAAPFRDRILDRSIAVPLAVLERL